MRFKRPQPYETRTVSKFLFLPKTIDGETRWLERAKIFQQYRPDVDSAGSIEYSWQDISWKE